MTCRRSTGLTPTSNTLLKFSRTASIFAASIMMQITYRVILFADYYLSDSAATIWLLFENSLVSTPSPMQPQPLFRVIAYPAFDDSGDRLHGALDIDAACGVARRIDCLR